MTYFAAALKIKLAVGQQKPAAGEDASVKVSQKAKEAILLGGVCAIAYLAVYLARNVLGTVSNQMVGLGLFDKEFVGSLSSTFFIT